jgi:ABC-type dipeptide/oligopeptide/nickel transport system permease component
MQQYIIRRLLLMIPTVLLVSIIVFTLIRLLPGAVSGGGRDWSGPNRWALSATCSSCSSS